jgi:hypothetical protein
MSENDSIYINCIEEKVMFSIKSKGKNLSCEVCNKKTRKRCSGCKVIHYCSKECQKKDRNKHKKECELLDSVRINMNKIFNSVNKKENTNIKNNLEKLNTSVYSKSRYFAWRYNNELVKKRSCNYKTIINWIKDEIVNNNINLNLSLCDSNICFDDFTSNIKACKNNIFPLRFDYKKKWCIGFANSQFLLGSIIFKKTPTEIDGGLICFYNKSYVLCQIDDIEFCKREIRKMIFNKVAKYKECKICYSMKSTFTPCTVCKMEICSDCCNNISESNFNKIVNCPQCRTRIV